MKYRLANEADFFQLAEMRWDFQTEDDPRPPVIDKRDFLEKCVAYLQQSYEKGDWTFHVAEENGEIIAHAFVKKIVAVPRPARIENYWGYLTNVYTKPDFRGKGIGTKLLHQVKRWSAALDFELLIVSPSEDSVNFYKREGFSAETDFYQLRLREF